MASAHCYDEIKAYLQGAMTPMAVLDWDQIESTLEQSNNQFLALEESYADEELIAFGNPQALCMREIGALIIHCFVPAPESSGVARALAGQVQNQIRLQRISGLRIISSDPPEVDRMNDGLWTTAAVPVAYEYDYFVARP